MKAGKKNKKKKIGVHINKLGALCIISGSCQPILDGFKTSQLKNYYNG